MPRAIAEGRRGTIGDEGKGRWRAWIFPLGIVTLWCAPAIAINISHGLQTGREPALMVAAVFAVFGAAMAGLRLETQCSFFGRLVTSACLAVLIAFNISNAVGLSAGSRDHTRSTALTEQNALQSLRDDKGTMERTMAALDKELAGRSISSLRSDIAAREYAPAFSRSKRCTDATRSESREHCAAWEKAKALLASAERRDQLTAELARLNEQLRAMPVRESIDPQSEALAQALAFAGIAAAPRDVGYGLTLIFALGIELMAAFGASWCGVRLPTHEASAKPARTAPVLVPKVAMPDTSALPVDPLAGFVADLVRSDTPMPFKALYAAYTVCCEAVSCEPKTGRAVGLALKTAGFEKSKADGGQIHYAVRMRGPRLAAVSAR